VGSFMFIRDRSGPVGRGRALRQMKENGGIPKKTGAIP
jgi:hypothetical protein